MFYKLQR